MRPLTIIESEADWTAASLKGREDEFTYHFSESDVRELVRAVDKLKARGVETEEDVKQVNLPAGGSLHVSRAGREVTGSWFGAFRYSWPARSVPAAAALSRLCESGFAGCEYPDSSLHRDDAFAPLSAAQERGLRPPHADSKAAGDWQGGELGARLPAG